MDVFLYTTILSSLALCAHIFLALFFVLKYVKVAPIQRLFAAIRGVLQNNGLLCALGVAVLSTVSPLVYTYVYHFIPCTLCWYQRIFMFPLVVLLLIAYLRKNFAIKVYVYALSAIGLCIGIYHYLLQRLHAHLNISSVGCDAVGMTQSCSEYYFMQFNYITIPLMAMTGFVLILFFTHLAKKSGS